VISRRNLWKWFSSSVALVHIKHNCVSLYICGIYIWGSGVNNKLTWPSSRWLWAFTTSLLFCSFSCFFKALFPTWNDCRLKRLGHSTSANGMETYRGFMYWGNCSCSVVPYWVKSMSAIPHSKYIGGTYIFFFTLYQILYPVSSLCPVPASIHLVDAVWGPWSWAPCVAGMFATVARLLA